MISGIVIVILVIIGIFAIKMNHLKHRVFIIMLILLALFLYSSMTLVGSKNELEYKSSDGIMNAVRVYTGWLANGFQNIKTVTGNVVKMDWASTNATFFKED